MSTPRPASSPAFASKRFQAGSSKVRSLAWSCEGKRIATGSDKHVRVHNPEKAASTELRGHTGDVSCVVWNPLQPELLASTSSDRNLALWDVRQGKPTALIPTEGDIINCAYSPDGTTIVLGSRKDLVTYVDVASQAIVRTQQMKAETNEFCFSPNGSLLYTCSDSTIAITSYPAGHPVDSVHVSSVSCSTLDLCPRGRFLGIGSNDAIVTIFETTDWTAVASLGHFDTPIRCVEFSPDGQLLAAGSEDPYITISSVPRGAEYHRIPTGFPTSALSWHPSPSKNILAYASEEIEGGRQNGVFRVLSLS